MRFTPTALPEVVVVDPQPMSDDRGSFARLYCPDEFAGAGLAFTPVQISLSRNIRRYTLRGLHFQAPGHEEAKLVRVTRGRIFDVAVDVRPGSPNRRQWVGTELDAESGRALFIPRGFAHGFITLEPDTDVQYQIDRIFEPGHDLGRRWNDPAFAIDWPAEPAAISERDATYADD